MVKWETFLLVYLQGDSWFYSFVKFLIVLLGIPYSSREIFYAATGEEGGVEGVIWKQIEIWCWLLLSISYGG